MMASFASVHVSAANKTIVPWSVISLDPSQNFGELFRSVQAGKYAIIKTSTDLTAAVLESSGSYAILNNEKWSSTRIQ